ncbi:MAG: glycosyltransferase [Bacteroidetes bacterium]|nr:glycosyltransferase [Bacteroidota bacterium]
MKQKIAILIDWYLPGTKAGGPVRSIYSLVSLLKDKYELYIITANYDLGTVQPYKNIKPNFLHEKEGVFYYYFSAENLNTTNILNTIKGINPDLIYLNSFWSYHFSISIIKAKKTGHLNTPVLLAPRGMLSSGALGLKSVKKYSYLFAAKLFNWYDNITFHATNEIEKKEILKQFKKAKIVIAPNLNSGTAYSISKPKQVNHLKMFYLSRVAKVKNLHYALEILREVPKDIKIEYDIYGNIEDKDYWLQCKNIISTLPENITVTGRHELQFNEVQSIIVSYHTLFLPTLNENFGHSIVESLLCGCLVIISNKTPWNDVEKENVGYAIDLSDKAGFVKAIAKMASLNAAEYAMRSASAINYISDKLNIEMSVEQYKKVFDESIKK